MVLKTVSSLFFLVIIFVSFILNASKVIAKEGRFNATCELNNTNITCTNLKSSEDLKVYLFNDPYRIQLDFKSKLNIKEVTDLKNQFIRNVRLNKSSKSKTKIVLESKDPTIISDINYYKTSNQNINLILYFKNTSEAKYIIAKHVLQKNKGDIFNLENDVDTHNNLIRKSRKITLPIIKKKNFKKVKSRKNFIVFIDPGHGGRDPGAIGQLGTLEKNITLKASVLLSKALRKSKKIIPILSRNNDVYLSLKKRTLLAKENKADIFVSIHADSSKNKKASGISVFSLSNKASDKEAQLLAQRENKVDNLLGDKEKIADPLIYGTLIKMFQREAMNDSAFLAKNILLNLEKTKLAVNRGHRFAGFSVLKSYDIPSVLIEIGFLSNKKEEKKLLNSKYLNELSRGLAISIENYFDNYEK